MGFENCKDAAHFPFMQPKSTSLVPNTTPFIDFGLNLLDTGRIKPTIRISVVMRPLNFSFFNRVLLWNFYLAKKYSYLSLLNLARAAKDQYPSSILLSQNRGPVGKTELCLFMTVFLPFPWSEQLSSQSCNMGQNDGIRYEEKLRSTCV